MDLEKLKRDLDSLRFDFTSIIPQHMKTDNANYSTFNSSQAAPIMENRGYNPISNGGVSIASIRSESTPLQTHSTSLRTLPSQHTVYHQPSPQPPVFSSNAHNYSHSLPQQFTQQTSYSPIKQVQPVYISTAMSEDSKSHHSYSAHPQTITRNIHSPSDSLQDLVFNSIEEYIERRANFGNSQDDINRIARLLLPSEVASLHGQQASISKSISERLEGEKKKVC